HQRARRAEAGSNGGPGNPHGGHTSIRSGKHQPNKSPRDRPAVSAAGLNAGKDRCMARKARKGRLGIYVALSGAILFLVWFGIGFTRPYAKAAVMAAENDRLERTQMELRIKQQKLRKN